MMNSRRLLNWKLIIVVACAALTACVVCAIAALIFSVALADKTSRSAITSTAKAEVALAAAQTETARPTHTPRPTDTPPPPTDTPRPTDTPPPPTDTPQPTDTTLPPTAPPIVIVIEVTRIVVVTQIVTVTPPDGDLLDQVTTAGKLLISTDPNYAPQSFLNDRGELDGFDIDVAKEVAKRLGVEAEFVTPDWDMITRGNWDGRWDLSIGSMTITEHRAQMLWFTDPYYYTPASFAVHKDNTTITTPDDLVGKQVGLGTATTYEAYLNGTLNMTGGQVMYDPPAVMIKPYTADAEAIQDLALGDGVRLDAVLSAQPTIQEAIASGVPLKYVGTPAFYESLAFALDKSRGPSNKMLVKLNEIVRAMHDDGSLTELSLKWYGIDLATVIEPGE